MFPHSSFQTAGANLSSAPFRIGRSWLNSPGKFAAALREEDLKLRLYARCGAAEMKRINDLWNSLAFGHRGHPTMYPVATVMRDLLLPPTISR
jgi:hypothetical protein